ncbi:MAG: homoserine dehydrogenase [Proteobacteria bacterium]|nr:homoserine dehydrogenase [Pseudomonadota bacterium]
MAAPFRIGIAGLGTVGCGVIELLKKNGNAIADRAGRPIRVVAVSARSRMKKRICPVKSYRWASDSLDMAADPKIDAVVELIGGQGGVAKRLAETTLKAGKPFVTANKALLAHHGHKLAMLAEKHGAPLMYEAAVAGGIPIIKTLREGLAANNISAVYGILNGTCNYILTAMRETGRDFHDALKEAQKLGYAEANPSFDIDGIDTAHKLNILSMLTFGIKSEFKDFRTRGITCITLQDILFAQELGYKIKLLGISRRIKNKIFQSVEPCLVPADSNIGSVEGVYNAVHVEGDFSGTELSIGRGAGGGPTASAVVADIIDLARGRKVLPFGAPAEYMKKAARAGAEDVFSRFYMRLEVVDRPGVLAGVSAIMRDHGLSIEAVTQRGRDPGKPVSIVMTTHMVKQKDMEEAADFIAAIKSVIKPPSLLRIEHF